MKVSYNREMDILLMQVGGGKVDHAEEMGPIIVHFTANGEPILLEMLDASETLTQLTKTTMTTETTDMVETSV